MCQACRRAYEPKENALTVERLSAAALQGTIKDADASRYRGSAKQDESHPQLSASPGCGPRRQNRRANRQRIHETGEQNCGNLDHTPIIEDRDCDDNRAGSGFRPGM
jgi:hypothetical protein